MSEVTTEVTTDQSGRETIFECSVTESCHYYDNDNYERTRDETEVMESASRECLLKALARCLTRVTQKRPGSHDEWITYSFGPIREILVLSEKDVDMKEIEQTRVWQSHIMTAEQKAREAAAAEARVQQEREAACERRQKEELLYLLEKFAPQAVSDVRVYLTGESRPHER